MVIDTLPLSGPARSDTVKRTVATISIQALRQSPDAYTSAITVQGVVTGHATKGYFVQEKRTSTEFSSGLFVYSPKEKPIVGHLAKVTGKVSNYQAREGDKTCIQMKPQYVNLGKKTRLPDPIELDMALLAGAPVDTVTQYLTSLEAMRVEIPANLTCVSPSNLFGDFVVAPTNWPGYCAPPGGVIISAEDPHRWIPSFRILDSTKPLNIFVGDRLASAVVGPLNYRSSAYQVAASNPVEFKPGSRDPQEEVSWGEVSPDKVSVMTLNTFNLDPKIERKQWVNDPQMDIDDDVGQRQYRNLANAIIEAGNCPDIVALQEIQDDDGAEITKQNRAQKNLMLLVAVIKDLSGVDYEYLDCPPELHAEGGQPGGNIRNTYLYRRQRVSLDGELVRLGEDTEAYSGSRKPVVATFRCLRNNKHLTVVNVHLASKRHQHSVFAADQPAHDPREVQRIAQCEIIERYLRTMQQIQQDYYVTGDFNDYEFSLSLQALTASHSTNLVETLPPEQRYDYNHRGRLLALMHGVISNEHHNRGGHRYQVLHGNELVPIDPDSTSSDHAYVLAELNLE